MGNTVLTVGALAKQTGITVRALHHYDSLGLVTPSQRSAKGYRLYDADDVARLQIVRALQDLGFSLQQIGTMLKDPSFSFKQVLGMQRSVLKEKIRLQQKLYKRLQDLESLMASRRQVPLNDVIYLLQIMNNISQFNLSPQEEEKLKKQWAQYSTADIKAVEAEWPKLIAEVRKQMQKGADPRSAEVQTLAKRWKGLVQMFTAGIPKMAERASKNLAENYQDLKQQHGDAIPDSEMMSYIDKALGGKWN